MVTLRDDFDEFEAIFAEPPKITFCRECYQRLINGEGHTCGCPNEPDYNDDEEDEDADE